MMTEKHNRMRWAARRGMLELDLVLEPFVRNRFAELGAQDRLRFSDLMSCEDQELYTWLMQREKPKDKELARIVDSILEYARTVPENR